MPTAGVIVLTSVLGLLLAVQAVFLTLRRKYSSDYKYLKQ